MTRLIVIYRDRYSRWSDAAGSYGPGDVEVRMLERMDQILEGWIVLAIQTVTFDPDGEL